MKNYNPAFLLAHCYANSLTQLKLIENNILIIKKIEPNIDIILSGHGNISPSELMQKNCKHIFWNEEYLKTEVGIGHPYTIQYALLKLKELKYTHIFKLALGSISIRKNLCNKLKNLLEIKNKKFIISQQTSLNYPRIGDQFIFSKIENFINLWDASCWYPTSSGMKSLGRNLLKITNSNNKSWKDILLSECLHINLYTLGIIDLRLMNKSEIEGLEEAIENNNLDKLQISEILWGAKKNHQKFNKYGEIIYNPEDLYISDDRSINL